MKVKSKDKWIKVEDKTEEEKAPTGKRKVAALAVGGFKSRDSEQYV